MLLERLVEAKPLVDSIGQRLGLIEELTLFGIISHPEVRAAIDVLLDPELMERVAGDVDEEIADVEKAVIQLSLDSWVLPPESANTLGDCTLSQLRKSWTPDNAAPSSLPWSRVYGTTSKASRWKHSSPRSTLPRPICAWWSV